MDRTINYTPLVREVTSDEVAEYRRIARAQRPSSELLVQLLVGGFIALVSLFVVGTALIPALVIGFSGLTTGDSTAVFGILPAILIGGMLAVAIVSIVRRGRPLWRERLKMHLFAEANGLVYEIASPAPDYPGVIFGQGRSRKVSDHFRTVDGRFLDFGNYQYTTGSGKNSTTHRWGFLALHLDRALPHIVLDSRANNGLFGASNLPSDLRRDQVLSLEGDFDRYFTLYCPKQYERDALYVFTPDLMALAIDEAAPFDMEIVDQWLFVYSARPFPLADPYTYQRLLRIVSTVGAKALSQTDRYRDERIGDFSVNLVAPQGQRLRKGVPWAGIAIVVGVAAVWMLMIVGVF